MTKDQKPDPVNSPAHYTAGAVEMIDYIEQVVATYPSDQAYCIGNAIKYISRAPLKGAKLQDLQKARWYLDRAIAAEFAKLKEKRHGMAERLRGNRPGLR